MANKNSNINNEKDIRQFAVYNLVEGKLGQLVVLLCLTYLKFPIELS